MTTDQIVYTVFGIVLILALIIDLGLLNKKNKIISIPTALKQTFFWVALAMCFFIFMWMKEGQNTALEYLSAYLMEWSLSIDNIFIFILIFSAFGVKEKYNGKVLLIGILMAIVFRIIFIAVGLALVQKFAWIMYIFGVFLLYTGYAMFTATKDEEFKPQESKIYKFLKRFLPLASNDGQGKFIILINKKPQYTTLFVVVVMLAAIDIVFAIDSLPAVMGISQNNLVVYTSNIFAVLGLRSLFFLLRGAVTKFDYLQQGIAIVLVFIGLKMLGEHYINHWFSKNTQIFISLGIIIACVSGSIFYSIFMKKKGEPAEVEYNN